MTPAVPAALPAAFPHTITVVQRDTITLEELCKFLKMTPNRVKQLNRAEGLPLIWAGTNGPIFSKMSLIDAWMEKRPIPENVKPVK